MDGRVLMSRRQAKQHSAVIRRAVAELPDRDSPAGQPEMMLVSHEELALIIERELLAE